MITKYNRSAKRYEIFGDDQDTPLATFPPGQEGKQQATLYSILATAPDVYEEMTAIIRNTKHSPAATAVENRAIKAAQILIDQKLLPARHWTQPGAVANEIARCKSSHHGGDPNEIWEYVIGRNLTDDLLSCSCIDNVAGFWVKRYQEPHPEFGVGSPELWNGQPACKHILALYIAEALEQKSYEREEAIAKKISYWEQTYGPRKLTDEELDQITIDL
jgi:hypothetical protein